MQQSYAAPHAPTRKKYAPSLRICACACGTVCMPPSHTSKLMLKLGPRWIPLDLHQWSVPPAPCSSHAHRKRESVFTCKGACVPGLRQGFVPATAVLPPNWT